MLVFDNIFDQQDSAYFDQAFQDGNFNISYRSRGGGSILHYAAFKGDLNRVRQLLDLGMDVNAKDDLGFTALHYAAQKNDLEQIQLLIERGADLNAESQFGKTIFDIAISPYKEKLVSWLSEREEMQEKLNYALRKLLSNSFSLFDEYVFFNQYQSALESEVGTDNLEDALLEDSIPRCNWNCLCKMIVLDEMVDDNMRNAVLRNAVLKSDWRFVKWIFIHGRRDVNTIFQDGMTALHYAAKEGDLDLVRWLVEHGADVNIKNDDGASVLDLAVQSNAPKLVQWFQQYAAN